MTKGESLRPNAVSCSEKRHPPETNTTHGLVLVSLCPCFGGKCASSILLFHSVSPPLPPAPVLLSDQRASTHVKMCATPHISLAVPAASQFPLSYFSERGCEDLSPLWVACTLHLVALSQSSCGSCLGEQGCKDLIPLQVTFHSPFFLVHSVPYVPVSASGNVKTLAR